MINRVEPALAGAAEWVLHSTRSEDSQVYWRLGARHAERRTATDTHALTVYVDRGDERGESVCYLTGDHDDTTRVADAITAAGLVLNPRYRLPEGPVEFPTLELGDDNVDPEHLTAFGEALQARIREAGVTVSHLELFAARDEEEVLGSNGRRTAWTGTRYEMDLVVAGGPEDAFEQRRLRHSRRLRDLAPDPVLERTLEVVRDRARAELPPTGRMAVVLPGEELSTLLQAVRARVSAEALYQHFFPYKVGDRLVETAGDAFTLSATGIRPHAVASAPTDTSTVPAGRVPLIRDGVIVGLIASPQYGAYLGVAPTGPAGTLEWEPGGTAGAELLAEGPVLEVVAFSANMPNPLTGDFAVEIKFGYLHEHGRRTPVAQGSVSANVVEMLAHCRRSAETEEHPGYFGPARVRFENVQVAGR